MKKALLAMGQMLLPAEMAVLDEEFDVIRLWRERDPDKIIRERAKDIVAISSVHYMPISRKLIESLPNLEIISQFAVGYDNIDLLAAKERGIAVTNTPDVLSECTADTGMCLFLAVSRRICEADMFVRVGKWQAGETFPLGVTPRGKKVGIVGLGRIGQAFATRAQGFGCEIVYHGRREQKDKPYTYYSDLKEMADDCDYLVLTCPGGEATKGIINDEILEALGPKGILINIARGSVVDEAALIKALQNKVIAGAGLDVFSDEPHVPEEFIKMDNVVLLPHIGSATVETRTVMGKLVVDNLLAHFRGDPLLTPVAA